ncbi:hypothetical protein LAUMK35_04444 [Mycobacterium pseudokansasii]|uniref:Uncharacterized protein n=1 Tax=Mycobacterium pseudokansasii TaxID=2341080 RepID=A0A498QT47_9MYCO|nr:hypothetical protein LAUMK35_04444 [Mycobacterium pseudokansasii]VBA30986.1 hypothetical protein LAUMK21_04437 [Mycobacterium pseudokansasii]VBA53854.1 hypothetical protein LAUMK142_04340 [Mycobacterium pseudokansasii]
MWAVRIVNMIPADIHRRDTQPSEGAITLGIHGMQSRQDARET